MPEPRPCAPSQIEARLARRLAIRGQQAQIGREIRNCLAELRALRKDALARTHEPEECLPEEQNYTNDLAPCTSGPEPTVQDEPNDDVRNEPKDPAAVHDDAALPAGSMPRNEPENPPPANGDAAPPSDTAPRNEPGRPRHEVTWPQATPAVGIRGRPRPQAPGGGGWRVPCQALEASPARAAGGVGAGAGPA